jgi:hypothetical protein
LNTPGKRGDAAAHYILCLLKQSSADETNGRSRWQATPFWGESAISPAREFRKKLIADFGNSAEGSRAQDIAFWLVCNDRLSISQKLALAIFKRGNDEQFLSMSKRLLQLPYSFSWLTPGIIDEVAARHLKQLLPEIIPLQNHYRKSVREAARRACQALGQDGTASFSPEQAFTPWLEQQLQSINKMVYCSIPQGSQFIHLKLEEKGLGSRQTAEPAGWILKETDDTVEVLDTFGERSKFPSKATGIIPYDLQREAADLIAARKQVDTDLTAANQTAATQNAFEMREKAQATLSRMGGLTAQFEPRSISAPEALVATWCFERGDKSTASQILFPRIDVMDDDRQLLEVVTPLIAVPYYHEMLDEFASRNYHDALAFADHLLKPPFKELSIRKQVLELSSQLKQRSADFKSFVLPTATEWNHLKEKMTTEQQIQYLAPRLRLLACVQPGQPASLVFEDPQFKEPISYSESNSGESPQRTEVINPFVQLSAIAQSPLEASELLPYLNDRNFILGISYWRDFAPQRTLHPVNELVAGIINKCARRPLVNLEKYESLSGADQLAYIQNARHWCQANGKHSANDLSLETCKTTTDRNEFLNQVNGLIQAKDARVLNVVDKRMNDFDAFATMDASGAIYDFADKPEARVLARKWLATPPPPEPATENKRPSAHDRWDAQIGARFWASLVLLKGDSHDQNRAIAELRRMLDSIGPVKEINWADFYKMVHTENAHVPYLLRKNLSFKVEELLKCKRPEARQLACRLGFLGDDDPFDHFGVQISKILFNAGCERALTRLTTLFRIDPGMATSGGKQFRAPLGLGDEAVFKFLRGPAVRLGNGSSDWTPPGFVYSPGEPEEIRKQKRQMLIQWLEKKFQEIKQGQPAAPQ